jgi:hypothetical protein
MLAELQAKDLERTRLEWGDELHGEMRSDGSFSTDGDEAFDHNPPSRYGRGRDLPKNYTPIRPALSFRYGRGQELPRPGQRPPRAPPNGNSPATVPNDAAEEPPLEMPPVAADTNPLLPENIVSPAPAVSAGFNPIAMCEMKANPNPCLTDAAGEQTVEPPPVLRVTIARGPCQVGIHTNWEDELTVVPEQEDPSMPVGEVIDISTSSPARA